MQVTYYKSPIGMIRISFTDAGICGLIFEEKKVKKTGEPELFTADYIRQLDAYFSGKLKKFNVPLDLKGTDFQIKVWKELLKIPFGHTISYMELAKKLGNPKSIRAAARANGQNPVSIIVPCHRVIGSNGSLTGYAGGLWRKKWLLELETGGHQGNLFEEN